MILESILKTLYDYLDGGQSMMPPFDELLPTGIVLILVLGCMRLFDGSWPWEAKKTWYRTRQAVDSVEASRAETKSDPAVRPVQDVMDTSTARAIADAVDASI